MSELPKKDQLYELIRANPFISQQDLADQLGLSRSAVAGHIASLIRERRLLGRAYVLPGARPIACIGAANLDRKLRSLATLTMGTSNPARQDEAFGGVARNIAENLARLGANVSLTTAVGGDASGRALLAHAQSLGIDTSATCVLPDYCSGTYTAVLDDHGEMLVALADMALYDALTPAVLAERFARSALPALIVADLNLPRESIAWLLAEAARGGPPLVIVAVSQPKMARLPAGEQSLRGLRLLILNQGELESRAGRPLRTDADFAAACAALQAEGVQDIIVTRGGAGVLFTRRARAGAGAGPQLGQLAALDATVVDVTGAGDAFAAGVCWSLQHEAEANAEADADAGGDLALACRRGLQLSSMTLACAQTVCPDLHPALFEQAGVAAAPAPPVPSVPPVPPALPARHAAQPFNALYPD